MKIHRIEIFELTFPQQYNKFYATLLRNWCNIKDDIRWKPRKSIREESNEDTLELE